MSFSICLNISKWLEREKKHPLISNHFSREPSNGTTSDQWLKWALFFLSTKLSPAEGMGNASGNLTTVLKPGGHPLCYLGCVVFYFSLPSFVFVALPNLNQSGKTVLRYGPR